MVCLKTVSKGSSRDSNSLKIGSSFTVCRKLIEFGSIMHFRKVGKLGQKVDAFSDRFNFPCLMLGLSHKSDECAAGAALSISSKISGARLGGG
jgi:hypothetical protein